MAPFSELPLCDEPAIVASASKHAGKNMTDPVSVLVALREWKTAFEFGCKFSPIVLIFKWI